MEPVFRSEDDLVQTCCGPIMDESEVVIVDTASLQPLSDGAVGEIWIAGPHVGTGYWRRPEASDETFRARLVDGRGPWLRTGDIGSLTPEGLYVTGRIKDLLIVRGRNYAPSDVEQLWADTFGLSGQATSAAFQVEQEDGSSHVVLLGEVDRAARTSATLHADIAALAQQIRKLALERLDLSITDLVMVAPGGVPRTTSGKVRRSAARLMLMAGELPIVGGTGPLMHGLTVEIQN
jgi:acyl-CoA synthetase (AMP-forming)/AMP-acid ligase II